MSARDRTTDKQLVLTLSMIARAAIYSSGHNTGWVTNRRGPNHPALLIHLAKRPQHFDHKTTPRPRRFI
jgi:hypothetical protein